MTRASAVLKPHPRHVTIHVNAFSLPLRVFFVLFVAALIIGEITSVPMWPPPIFYPYCALKLLGFVLIGVFTPIGFWRFNALNRGLFYAAVSAALVETLQAVVHRGHSGHSFHWYELVVKLVLILFGFSIGLDIRYEQQLKIGPIHILLHSTRDA